MLRKLLQIPARELRDRLSQRLADELSVLTPAPRSTSLTGKQLRPRTPWPERFFGDALEPEAAPDAARIIARANAAMLGRIDLLGLGELQLPVPIDSAREPVSGLSAPDRHWLRVEYLDPAVVGDHKIVWEINRHQWLVWVAQAFAVTGDERYAQFVMSELTRWISQNPVGRGINWVSSLELSLRSIQWVAILHLLRRSAAAESDATATIVRHLEQQITHVQGHLSTYFAPNTHLTGEALGMVVAGIAWPGWTRSAALIQTGKQVLEQQAKRQILDDGAYFEQSSWYQAYTVDFYVEAARWLKFAGHEFGASTLERVHRAAQYLRNCCRPDGSLFRYGDDDGGSLWRVGFDEAPHHATLARAAAFLNDPALLVPGMPDGSATYALALNQSKEKPPVREEALSGIWTGANGGLVRMWDAPDANTGADTCFVDAGPHGAYGHPHSDALAIDLSIAGESIVADPGTGSYVTQSRQKLRGTGAHATARYNGVDTSRTGDAFSWASSRSAHLSRSGSDAEFLWAEGVLDGSVATGEPFEHKRTVVRLRSRIWIVLDFISGAVEKPLIELHFPLASGISPVVDGSSITCSSPRGNSAVVCADPQFSVNIIPALYSPAYGCVQNVAALALADDTGLSATYCTVFGAGTQKLSLSRPDARKSHWEIQDSVGRITLMAGHGTDVTSPLGLSFDGDWCLIDDRSQDGVENSDLVVLAAGPGTLQGPRLTRPVSISSDVQRVVIPRILSSNEPGF